MLRLKIVISFICLFSLFWGGIATKKSQQEKATLPQSFVDITGGQNIFIHHLSSTLTAKPAGRDIIPATGERLSAPKVRQLATRKETSSLAEALVALKIVAPNETLFSLGSGTGYEERVFAEKGNMEVLASENNEVLFAELKQIESEVENFRAQKINLEKIEEWPDEQKTGESLYDVIYLRMVLHFFPDDIQAALLERFYALLKPGGKLILQLKSKNDPLYSSPDMIRDFHKDPRPGMVHLRKPVDETDDNRIRNFLYAHELITKIRTSKLVPVGLSEHEEHRYPNAPHSSILTAISIKPTEPNGARHPRIDNMAEIIRKSSKAGELKNIIIYDPETLKRPSELFYMSL